MDSLVAGQLGGLAGTAAMSALMMPMMKGSPGAPQFMWSRLRGVDPTGKEAQGVGMMIHFGYGAFWGLVLGWVLDAFVLGLAPWLAGLVLGVILLMVAMFVVMPSLGMKPPEGEAGKMMVGMAAAHVVYGVVTGLVLGWLT